MNWNEFNQSDKNTHPPKAGKYLIYRKGCDKMHFEKWNGTGWSSSNNTCTHWVEVEKPVERVGWMFAKNPKGYLSNRPKIEPVKL